MALNPLSLARGVEPRVRDGVRGEALSITAAASPETSHGNAEQGNSTSGTYRMWSCEARLIVRAPGITPAFLNTYRQMTREKYLIPGLPLPVTVSQRDRSRVRIEWDEVPTIDELIARGDPLFTDPDATRPLIREAFAAARIEPPLPGPQREEIDGPNARVISFGGGGSEPGLFTSTRKVDVLLSVAIPGRGRFGFRWLGKAPRERMLFPGTNVPVVYDPARPDEVDIPWDEVGVTRGQLVGMARSAVVVKPDQLDLLRRAGALHAAGVLTDAELAAEKARILGRGA